MADEKDEGQQRLDDAQRFSMPPPPPDAPEIPHLNPKLPPLPRSAPGQADTPGEYGNLAIAASAASSFVAPILVLSVLGWFIDQKLHHDTAWLAFGGVIVGMITGLLALTQVMKKLSR